MSHFAKTILEQKYSAVKKDGNKETWDEVAYRVSKHVMKAVGASKELTAEIRELIKERKFIPGGRYLYSAGKPYHQVQNCLLLRAEDSREGWADLLQKASLALMTGAGIGVDYSDIRAEGKPIRKTGGVATGPIALAQMLNECGRGIMQGGSRRSAIWAGLNWKHADIQKFITLKNWSQDVRKLKEKDFNFPAAMDGTNISVQLDDEFFKAYHDDKHVLHNTAHQVYWAVIKQMLKTAEPGFSVDVGENKGETLRNACVAGETEILTRDGYKRIEECVNEETQIWNGFEWSTVIPKVTGTNQEMVTVTFSDGRILRCTKYHKFLIAMGYSGDSIERTAEKLNIGDKLIKCEFPVIEHGLEMKHAYLQGFHSAEGMNDYNFIHVYEPKKVCLERLKQFEHLLKFEPNNKRYRFVPNIDLDPKNFVPFQYNLKSKLDWLSGLFDGDGTELKEGGLQLASVDHEFLYNVQKLLTTVGVQSKVVAANKAGKRMMPDGHGGHKLFDCKETKRICIGAVQMQKLKELGLSCERLKFEKSPQRDATQFVSVVDVTESGTEDMVFCFNEPKNHTGIFDGTITSQCTEVTSRDDSDICNLGSINLARITSLSEMSRTTELATAFLLAGTVYSDVPYSKVDLVRTKNRRLGLGLMGIHEWLLVRGKKYGPDNDLENFLKEYEKSTEYAEKYANEWELSIPVKTRAIAPVGSIGIIGETTTGIEPIYCAAFKRRYLKGGTWNYQYVLDPTAKKLVDKGVNPDTIEDAYTLAENVERRVEFQAWVQQFVDHGISSTINIPAWGSELNNDSKVQDFGNMLIKYLPKLRGVTCYPDGGRNGQPLTPVKWGTAEKQLGEIFIEQVDICDLTKMGSCGS